MIAACERKVGPDEDCSGCHPDNVTAQNIPRPQEGNDRSDQRQQNNDRDSADAGQLQAMPAWDR